MRAGHLGRRLVLVGARGRVRGGRPRLVVVRVRAPRRRAAFARLAVARGAALAAVRRLVVVRGAGVRVRARAGGAGERVAARAQRRGRRRGHELAEQLVEHHVGHAAQVDGRQRDRVAGARRRRMRAPVFGRVARSPKPRRAAASRGAILARLASVGRRAPARGRKQVGGPLVPKLVHQLLSLVEGAEKRLLLSVLVLADQSVGRGDLLLVGCLLLLLLAGWRLVGNLARVVRLGFFVEALGDTVGARRSPVAGSVFRHLALAGTVGARLSFAGPASPLHHCDSLLTHVVVSGCGTRRQGSAPFMARALAVVVLVVQ